jgi:hypothetical protein
MSRSRRRRPFSGITSASSEKEDKVLGHRRARRVNAPRLHATLDDTTLVHERHFLNPWLMAKDGKQRFDPFRFPRLLRK